MEEQTKQPQQPAEERAEEVEDTPGQAELEQEPMEALEESLDQEDEEQEEEADLKCQIKLNYRITVDQFFNFQMNTSRTQVEKNKKRSVIISLVEIGFGLLYLAMLLLQYTDGSIWMYLVCLALIGVGSYSFFFYRYSYEKQLYKSVEKQHAGLEYFQNEIRLELFPNKCVERSGKMVKKTYWRNMWGVMHPGDAFYIMLDEKSCLLVPKEPLGEKAAEVEKFLRDICERFEKKWKEM